MSFFYPRNENYREISDNWRIGEQETNKKVDTDICSAPVREQANKAVAV